MNIEAIQTKGASLHDTTYINLCIVKNIEK